MGEHDARRKSDNKINKHQNTANKMWVSTSDVRNTEKETRYNRKTFPIAFDKIKDTASPKSPVAPVSRRLLDGSTEMRDVCRLIMPKLPCFHSAEHVLKGCCSSKRRVRGPHQSSSRSKAVNRRLSIWKKNLSKTRWAPLSHELLNYGKSLIVKWPHSVINRVDNQPVSLHCN